MEPSIRAIIFDVDGTLYDQFLLRRLVLGDLIRAQVGSPLRLWRTTRILRAYRRAQDTLRSNDVASDIAARQLALTLEETGYSRDLVEDCIREWMEEAPHRHWRACIEPCVHEVLALARRLDIRLAVCSDYPALRKLEKMGLSGLFDPIVCAQDPQVGYLKPHPRMLEIALQKLDLPASEALYVGDRRSIDGVAAARAGIEYFHMPHGASRRCTAFSALIEKVHATR